MQGISTIYWFGIFILFLIVIIGVTRIFGRFAHYDASSFTSTFIESGNLVYFQMAGTGHIYGSAGGDRYSVLKPVSRPVPQKGYEAIFKWRMEFVFDTYASGEKYDFVTRFYNNELEELVRYKLEMVGASSAIYYSTNAGSSWTDMTDLGNVIYDPGARVVFEWIQSITTNEDADDEIQVRHVVKKNSVVCATSDILKLTTYSNYLTSGLVVKPEFILTTSIGSFYIHLYMIKYGFGLG